MLPQVLGPPGEWKAGLNQLSRGFMLGCNGEGHQKVLGGQFVGGFVSDEEDLELDVVVMG